MTMATKGKANRYEMLVNVPVTIDIKYVDVWPDNGYGSQVSLKGTINGETTAIYLKGKAWANLKALAEAGVIAGYEKEHEEPAEKVNIPVVNGKGVTLNRSQAAGERFPTLIVLTSDGTPPKTERQTGKQPIDLGGPIPGLDDDGELPPPVEQAYEGDTADQATRQLDGLFLLYRVCFSEAVSLAAKHQSVNPDVSAMAATLFIEANHRGIRL